MTKNSKMREILLEGIQIAQTRLASVDPASPDHAKWTRQLQNLTASLQRSDTPSPQSEISNLKFEIPNAPFHPENRNAQENQPLATGTPAEQPRNAPGTVRNEAGTQRNIPEHSAHIPNEPPPQTKAPFTPREVKLSSLSAAEQEHIYNLLASHTYEQTIAILAEPPPRGLGIKTSNGSLCRLREKMYARLAADVHRLRHESVAQAFPDLPANASRLQVAAGLVEARLAEAALQPDLGVIGLKMLVENLNKLRAADLAERKLTLAEKRLAAAAPKNG